MILDIDRLHKEGKTERQSGRTTDMLAEVVGSALVSGENKTIFVVSIDSHHTWYQFVDVLRAIDPGITYNRTIKGSAPCIAIRNDYSANVYVKFSEVYSFSHYEYTACEIYIDHAFLEREEVMLMEKAYNTITSILRNRTESELHNRINQRIVLLSDENPLKKLWMKSYCNNSEPFNGRHFKPNTPDRVCASISSMLWDKGKSSCLDAENIFGDKEKKPPTPLA